MPEEYQEPALRLIEQLSPDDVRTGARITVWWDQPSKDETFICTKIGQIAYLVSIRNGLAYTRPQLIESYENRNAQFKAFPKQA